MKRAIALFLCIVMCLSLFPLGAFAENENEKATESAMPFVKEEIIDDGQTDTPLIEDEIIDESEPIEEPEPISPLWLTNNLPASYTATPGETVTLSIEATGGDGSISYQWWCNTGALIGSTGSSISFQIATPNEIWCVVTSGDQSISSNHCQLSLSSEKSGSCGENLTWTLTNDGVLEISGTGVMEDYNGHNSPWYSNGSFIKTVKINSGVTSIGRYAFYELSNISKLILSDTVTQFGQCAFYGCGIKDISVSEKSEYFRTVNNVLFNYDMSELILFPNSELEQYTLPKSVVKVLYGAFSGCKNLKTIDISNPKGLISMDLSGCQSIENIDLSECCNLVDVGCFYCSNLKSIEIPGSVTCIGACAFQNCSSLKSLVVSPSVNTICDSAFRGCTSLETIVIPEGVDSLPGGAFLDCIGLKSISIPSSVIRIGGGAFSGCFQLAHVYYSGTSNMWKHLKINENNAPLSTAQIHYGTDTHIATGSCGENITWSLDSDTLTLSGSGASYDYSYPNFRPWEECDNFICQIIVGNGITRLGSGLFNSLENLASVKLPASLRSIGDCGFANCTRLKKITLPPNLETIGMLSFSGLWSLESVSIPSGVKNIPDAAFAGCSSLRSVSFPDALETIGEYAFCGDTCIESLVFPESLTEIKTGAFTDCEVIESVTFQNNMEKIGNAAFYGCYSIDDIWFNGSKEEWDSISIGIENRCLTSAELHCSYVPRNILTLPTELKKIESEAFMGIPAEVIIVPATVTEIGNRAFADCKNLYQIIFLGTPVSIADNYLEGCGNVKIIKPEA